MGPLAGIKVIEIAGIGPGPFAAMMLADMGADVLRLDRIAKRPASHASPAEGWAPDGSAGRAARARALPGNQAPSLDLLNRGRPSVGIDLKQPDAVTLVLELVAASDVLLEGFRPGVMERLGLGPDACLERNPRLVYGRMTGWGQDGPLAQTAGHDVDYIALAGALHAIGRAGERPLPPLNLVGDFGGGGMLLAFGVACALIERGRSGQGQVVDAAMIDGAATLMTMFFGMQAMGFHRDARGTNMLDTGAHFYDVYEAADGKHVAVGAIEPQFYAELLARLGLQNEPLPPQMERASWPAMRARLAAIFRTKTRDEWSAVFDGSDACVAPVLSMREAAEHPHLRARGTLVQRDGVLQPAPAPRFSRTQPSLSSPPSQPGADTERALAAWGVSASRIAALRASQAIG